MVDDPRELDATVAGCAEAHQRLLGNVDDLGDDEVRLPSLLPGWSVGHVLTHLARNADSHVRMFEGAERGEMLSQYERGAAGRADDIEAGAARSAAELVADLRRSIWRLEQTWATASATAWDGAGLTVGGERQPCVDLPFRRWREVEVHHADLGLPSFTYDDWSEDYVRRELRRQLMVWRSRLPMGIGELPEAVTALAPRRRLAWLLGRHAATSLPEPGPWG